MRKHVLKIDKAVHIISSTITKEKIDALKTQIETIQYRENSYKELFNKNQEILKSSNELLIKLAGKININPFK